jgi:hypothetical protein
MWSILLVPRWWEKDPLDAVGIERRSVFIRKGINAERGVSTGSFASMQRIMSWFVVVRE